MPSKTPHTNGTDPVENGINGTKDVEMKDDAPAPLKGGKGKKAKEGEEEMTVVVPPPKGSKLSATPSKDNDGDITMNGPVEEDAEDDRAVKVDPVTKAVAGMSNYPCAPGKTKKNICARYQKQLSSARACCHSLRC